MNRDLDQMLRKLVDVRENRDVVGMRENNGRILIADDFNVKSLRQGD